MLSKVLFEKKITDVRDVFFDALPSQTFELPMTKEIHDLIISAMEFDCGLDVLGDALLIKYGSPCPTHILALGPFHVDERPVVHPCTSQPLLIDANDFATLNVSCYVVDAIVNSFTSSLRLPPNVCVLTANILECWIRGFRIKRIDFAHAKHILMPVQVDNNHWVLLYADKAVNVIYAMDSNSLSASISVIKATVHACRFLGMRDAHMNFVQTQQQIQFSNDCAMFVCRNILMVLYGEDRAITRDVLRCHVQKRPR